MEESEWWPYAKKTVFKNNPVYAWYFNYNPESWRFILARPSLNTTVTRWSSLLFTSVLWEPVPYHAFPWWNRHKTSPFVCAFLSHTLDWDNLFHCLEYKWAPYWLSSAEWSHLKPFSHTKNRLRWSSLCIFAHIHTYVWAYVTIMSREKEAI